MRSFGAFAPLKQLMHKFGFTVENVAEAVRQQIRLAYRGVGQ
jgi:transketolase